MTATKKITTHNGHRRKAAPIIPPGRMPSNLESEIKKYVETHQRRGMSRRTLVRMTHRKFGVRIEQALIPDPLTQYRAWFRPLVRLWRLFFNPSFKRDRAQHEAVVSRSSKSRSL